MNPPRVRVLLATFNGARWLDEQLRSVFNQVNVEVSVIVSDDRSTDATAQLLSRWRLRAPLRILPSPGIRFGSAHRNFLRLIRDASAREADFFALCDQDDIWLPGKLDRGITCLCEIPADAYSSDVVAFWPDGVRRRVRKSRPQRTYDHLFGSPGPGCTFVLPQRVFEELQSWVREHFERLQEIWVHDWLIYAFVRSRGMNWYIDEQANMLYRQHATNEIGVNAGWSAALDRFRRVREGAYRREILAIADAVGESSYPVRAVRRLSLADRAWLACHVHTFRRSMVESLILAVFVLLMPRPSADSLDGAKHLR